MTPRSDQPRYSDDWAGAVCAQLGVGESDALFFSTHPAKVAAAVGLCFECPLRGLCLSRALDEEANTPPSERFGVRGGLTPAQRADRPKLCRDCGTPVVTNSKLCDDDRADRDREWDRTRKRQERWAA